MKKYLVTKIDKLEPEDSAVISILWANDDDQAYALACRGICMNQPEVSDQMAIEMVEESDDTLIVVQELESIPYMNSPS